MSIPSILARLEKLEGERELPGPIMVLQFPDVTEAEALSEHDRFVRGTRDPSRDVQFIQVRGVNPICGDGGTVQ